MKGKIGRKKTIAIYNKTRGYCWYCGKWVGLEFSIDHVEPRSSGGGSSIDNLVPCCRSCNSSKGPRSLEEFREMERFRLPSVHGVKTPPLSPD